MFRKTALSALFAASMTLAVVGQMGAEISLVQNIEARAHHPSFGGLMTEANRPHYVKLGQETRWALAARASHSGQ
jgi:hypothetical protein